MLKILPIFFISFALFQVSHAIIPQRVILAADANRTYIEFWPIVAKAWKERIGIQPTLALIADDVVQVDESLGDVIRFKPLPGIPSSFYSQIIRLLIPILYPNEVCILSDIDMLPISKVYYVNLIASIPDDHLIVYNDRAYGKNCKQYPICYTVAKGSTFKEIFGVNSIDEIPTKIQEWYAYKIGWTADETILYWSLRKWKGHPNRLNLLGYETGNQRIDRSKWQFNPTLLKAGYYIDSHMLRPYSVYKDKIDPVLEGLGLITAPATH